MKYWRESRATPANDAPYVRSEIDDSRVVDGCLPLLRRAQWDGKNRHIGISERWNEDPSHAMLDRALDDHFDLDDHPARKTTFPT